MMITTPKKDLFIRYTIQPNSKSIRAFMALLNEVLTEARAVIDIDLTPIPKNQIGGSHMQVEQKYMDESAIKDSTLNSIVVLINARLTELLRLIESNTEFATLKTKLESIIKKIKSNQGNDTQDFWTIGDDLINEITEDTREILKIVPKEQTLIIR